MHDICFFLPRFAWWPRRASRTKVRNPRRGIIPECHPQIFYSHLLEPLSEHSPIASFIEKRGEGIHHVALGVDHIEQRIEELKNNGIRMIHEQPKRGAGGARIAFMHPKSARGVLYELCEKVGGQ
ncbi:4-hydroxyphenylpyruvate dioxygenase [Anoxybacillus thermarum]|uniref:4-hydroxyphenylpyruvate dioxygenase n=1 Tax=Anoxybacillus thermarum TaxID=404937 RepID=A0A0D0Q5B3_9BACL|nr:VOC family protein [Anoxybacillus thermarum]KIQ93223.1 4-hydroxyphenylpyruvate dioxygenase [Anoxybacillus thermarum]